MSRSDRPLKFLSPHKEIQFSGRLYRYIWQIEGFFLLDFRIMGYSAIRNWRNPRQQSTLQPLARHGCTCGNCGIAMPPLPEKPIETCIAGPGLISSLIVSKTGDHLPIYRSEDILVRQGLHISRSTQCDWPQRRSPVSRTDIPDQHTAGIPPSPSPSAAEGWDGFVGRLRMTPKSTYIMSESKISCRVSNMAVFPCCPVHC